MNPLGMFRSYAKSGHNISIIQCSSHICDLEYFRFNNLNYNNLVIKSKDKNDIEISVTEFVTFAHGGYKIKFCH